MFCVAICDDEKYYREQIENVLVRYFNKYQMEHEIDVFSSGEDFIKGGMNLTKYNAVFLDIKLKEMNGIDLAYLIRQFNKEVSIAFVTSYINFAFEGYKVDAIRYILKDELDISIEECMNVIVKKIEGQLNKIEINFLCGYKQIYTDKIVYVESRKHKLTFKIVEDVLNDYEIYEKLDNFDLILKEYGFLRIHKSYLVNMKYIKQINNYRAILFSNEELPIPKPRYQQVKESFVDFKGEL